MKKMLVIAVSVSLLLTAGCGSEYAGGAVAGAAAGGALQGIMTAYQQQTEMTLAQLDAAQKRLEAATTEADRIATQAEIDALKKQVEKDVEIKTVVETGTAIASADWRTPSESAAGAALIANLLTQWYFNRKKKV
jgi:hypothetical protein